MNKRAKGEGLILVPKGGRPPRYARDAAVLVAYRWRTELLQSTAKAAEEWVVDQWKHHGLTEDAHVRATMRRCKKRTPWLASSLLRFNDGISYSYREGGFTVVNAERVDWVSMAAMPSEFRKDACCVAALATPVRDGGLGCFWMLGMHEALVLRVASSTATASPAMPLRAGPG